MNIIPEAWKDRGHKQFLLNEFKIISAIKYHLFSILNDHGKTITENDYTGINPASMSVIAGKVSKAKRNTPRTDCAFGSLADTGVSTCFSR